MYMSYDPHPYIADGEVEIFTPLENATQKHRSTETKKRRNASELLPLSLLDNLDAIDAVETGAGMSAHGYASRKAARAAPTHAPSNPYATKKGASSEEEMADIGSQDRQVHRTSNSSSASSSTSSKLKNKLKSKKKDREEGVRESAKAQVLGKRFDLLAKEVCVFYFPFLALPTRSSGYCFDHPNPVPSFLIYIICPVSSCTYHTIHSSFLVCVNNSL